MAVDRQLEEPLPPGSDSPIEKALETLILGVEDWKEVKVEALGKLLLHKPYSLPKCGQEEPVRRSNLRGPRNSLTCSPLA